MDKLKSAIAPTDIRDVEAIAEGLAIAVTDIVYWWDPTLECWSAGENTGTGVEKFADNATPEGAWQEVT